MAVTIGLALVALLGVTVAALWWSQRSLIYFPDTSTPPRAAAALPGGQDVTLTTDDGLELAAYYLPPGGGCEAAVLVAPGNGGHRGARVPLARALHERGFAVLVPDYRGYGGNPGAPSEQGLVADLRAGRAFLRDQLGDAPVIYLGESLGAAVAARLALEDPPAGLVLRSPFTSLADAGRAAYRLPVGWLLRDRYPVKDRVVDVASPVAVVYGEADRIVPPAQSRAVAEAARRGGGDVIEVAVPDADHNDPVLGHGPAVLDSVAKVAAKGGVTGCG